MASALVNPPKTSRSNSISSSSVITIQRTTSTTTRNHTRQTPSGLRSPSPAENSLITTNLSAPSLSTDERRRSSAVYNRPDSGNGVKEGVGNLNRWSQSTASSKSSATHNRRGSFSRRLSGSFGSFGGFTNPHSTSPSGKVLTKPRPSPQGSPQDHPTRSSPTRLTRNLPPIVTLSSLSYGANATDSPSTAATVTAATADLLSTSTSASSDPGFFEERWKAVPLHTQWNASSVAARISSPRHPAESPGVEASRPSGSADPAVSLYSVRGSSRLRHPERYQPSPRRHSRNRDEAGRGSAGTEGESSASSARSLVRPHKRKAPSQKAMLSKALQKAKHAVLLDNAQNFEGAMVAYRDACALLKQVMARSATDEDRNKLEAVRTTYSNRIYELQSTDVLYHGADSKALPEPPRERDSQDQEALLPITEEANGQIKMPVAAAGPLSWMEPDRSDHHEIPMMPQSMIPSDFRVEDQILRASELAQRQQMQYETGENHDPADSNAEPRTGLEIPSLDHYIPPPLSPRRPSSPGPLPDESCSRSAQLTASEPSQSHHAGQDTAESTSWLDTIDESGGSSSSSVHSRTSSTGLRRKHIRATSGTTEAEFDAALDAAVEAAYPDGFEPDDDGNQPLSNPGYEYNETESVSDARRNVELAKEVVREAEREAAILLAKDREKRRLQEKLEKRDSIDLDYGDEELDEEERMLEEMTRDYIMDESEYDVQCMSALPRQSDSSGFSGRTWGSSIGSNPTTAATSLSTVAETAMRPSLAKQLQAKSMPPPTHPPPLGALPPPPKALIVSSPAPIPNDPAPNPNRPISRMPSLEMKGQPGVRERRQSGINVKNLTIDTHSRGPSTAEPSPLENKQPSSAPLAMPAPAVTELPKSAPAPAEPPKETPNLIFSPPSATTPLVISRKELPLPSGLGSKEGAGGAAAATSAPSKMPPPEADNNTTPIPSSPGRFTAKAVGVGLRKNFSSSSLRNRSMTASATDIFEISPNTPSTAAQRKAPSTAVPSLPTPAGTNFVIDRLPVYLLETNIHSPISPGSPNPLATNAPLPLECCPESPLLRPFWFLRCIYHTIAHPRGAYLSTKLFVPRDIWRVKGVKLKNLEEKISQCDLLTAALLKLAKVDTVDADSVLVEMQFLESVMDQAQTNLSKKLGNDVGVVGASALLKGSSPLDDAAANLDTMASKSSNSNNKSYLSSWRKLRSKNSLGPSITPGLTPVTSRDGSRDGPTMESLPMTNISDPRFAKRDVSQVQYTGPNSNYMAALARLCDAVQVLDQIARQVEDPGLRHSSQTHVGLELSMRHAAEFFGFYICRFVFSDVSMMLDKFVKRGTEWVLA
ncbi:hypothetical protein MMC07_005673 [Pseudocyphellaria aurata]|nr:hypothetical protein [Pseudocyphellaria aurata]